MKFSETLAPLLLSIVAFTLAGCGSTECVTFDPLALGTQYGTPVGQVPGDALFSENGIDVTIHELPWPGGGSGFNSADVRAAGVFGSGHVLHTNNVTLEFNISGLSFTPQRATFEFRDTGGSEHLEVDRCAPRYTGEIQAVPLPFALCGGVAITSITTAPAPGGVTGDGTLEGPILRAFRAGGQEFELDNVCFHSG